MPVWRRCGSRSSTICASSTWMSTCRGACFKEIGGFVRQVMWDGIDCHRCRMLGWIAESLDAEAVRFIHLRPQGASHKGIWTGRLRKGFGQYFMGTSPLYQLAVAIYHLPAYP